MLKKGILIFSAVCLMTTGTGLGANYQINIDTSKKGVDISSTLYGIFFEDINYAADGGIYAELIQNRSFEFGNVYSQDRLYAWGVVLTQGTKGNISVKSDDPLNQNNQHYLRIVVKNPGKDGFGVANFGYDGIPLIQDDKYNFSMYARSENYTGPIQITLEGPKGEIYAKAMIYGLTDEWKKFSCILTPDKTTDKANLVIRVKGTATVDVDMVSLFPQRTWQKRENGLRYDLVKLLYDMRPGFIRFPGGCIVEGDSFENMYNWKNTIGDISERKIIYNLWHSQKFPHYHQSFGLGFYEYFLLCKDLEAKPVPVINCGMTCQVRGGDYIPLNKMDSFVQNALDLIEFATGATDAKWGSVRAEMGYQKPFNLKFLGIGNEQWGSPYYERYQLFHKAIKAKHPGIKLVAGVGPSPDDGLHRNAMKWIESLKSEKRPDIIDEHIYKDPKWFYLNIHRYDSYDRNMPKIFIGELAAHTSNRENNLEAALAEAAFLTAVEENSDVVKMVSYAPLFGKKNYAQWKPNLIWFNNTMAYGSVNYYVWKMFSRNLGDYTLETTLKPSEKIEGSVGVGSWRGEVLFDDFQIVSNTDDTLLFEDDFSADIQNWKIVSGLCNIKDGFLSSRPEPVRKIAYNMVYLKDKKLKNYALTFKAKRVGVMSSVLLYIGVEDDGNYVMCNLQSENSYIEMVSDGTRKRYEISPRDYSPIEHNKWYNIKIMVSGNRLRLYIKQVDQGNFIAEDKPVFDVVVKPMLLYVASSRDRETGDIIIKAVNTGNQSLKSRINISGVSYINPVGLQTVLSGKHYDKNSFSNPRKIVPITTKIEGISGSFVYEFKPSSVTMLRLKTTSENFPKPQKVTVTSNKIKAKPGDTLRVEITECLMSNGNLNDLSDAVIVFETNHPEIIEFKYDITTGYNSIIHIEKKTKGTKEIQIWAKVSINGEEVKSNKINLFIKVP